MYAVSEHARGLDVKTRDGACRIRCSQIDVT